MACSCSCLLAPCLNGYPDIGGLLCVASLLLLVSGWDWGSFHLRDNSLIALLLLLILIQRRYYGFFVVGFVVGWSVHALVCWLSAPGQRRVIFKNYLFTMLYVGGVSLIILLAVFEGFFRMSLFGDYGTKYQAYAGASLLGEFRQALGFYGWGLLLIILLGAAMIVMRARRNQNISEIPELCMLLSMGLISSLAFFRVQAMGMQHQYVIAAPILLLILIGLAVFGQVLCTWKPKTLVWLLVSAFFLTNFLIPMSIVKGDTPLNPLLSKLHYTPKIRNDIPVLEQLHGRLQELTEQDDTFAYILASSDILNNDILYKLYYPEARSIRIPGHAHVDLRDGFAPTFFTTEYVVVCDPVQYHLKASDQQVIGLLANDVLNQTGIGTHYVFMEEYTLDRGVKARLYHRATPFTEDDLRELADRYDQLYPDYPELFRDRILAQI